MTTQTLTPQKKQRNDNSSLVGPALQALPRKMSPLEQSRNPVMFVVWVGAALTTMWSIAAPSLRLGDHDLAVVYHRVRGVCGSLR